MPRPSSEAGGAGRLPPRRPWRPRHLHAFIGADHVELELREGRGPRALARIRSPLPNALGAAATATPGSGAATIADDPAQAAPTLAVALEALARAMAARGGGPLRGLACDMVLGDHWLHYDVLPADLRTLPARGARELVRGALADVCGLAEEGLDVRWQSQGASGQSLVCGLPVGSTAALKAPLLAAGVALRSLQGQLVACVNLHRKRLTGARQLLALHGTQGCQLALLEGGVVRAVSFESGEARARELAMRGHGLVRSMGLADGADPERLVIAPAGWETEGLWLNPQTVAAGSGVRAPAAASSAKPRAGVAPGFRASAYRRRLNLQFAPPLTHTRSGRWLAGLGVVALAAGAYLWQQAQAQARDARRLAAASAPAPAPSALRIDPKLAQAQGAISRSLTTPWSGLLRTLEQLPSEQVALLGVEPLPARQSLRVVAEARDPAAMLDYVDALRAHGFPDATLNSHQLELQIPGAPLHFVVQAHWDAADLKAEEVKAGESQGGRAATQPAGASPQGSGS